MEIDHIQYIDCMKARELLIKIAKDLTKIENDQSKKSQTKAKQKPTINHWHARGSYSVASWLLKRYPVIYKIGKNPELYKDMDVRMFNNE